MRIKRSVVSLRTVCHAVFAEAVSIFLEEPFHATSPTDASERFGIWQLVVF